LRPGLLAPCSPQHLCAALVTALLWLASLLTFALAHAAARCGSDGLATTVAAAVDALALGAGACGAASDRVGRAATLRLTLAAGAVAGLTRDAQFVAAERLARDVVDGALPPPPRARPRDPTGMQATRLHAPAPMDALARPHLCVVVDTEEQFDWQGPFSRHNVAVSAIGALPLAQTLFARYGLRPAYLLDHPIVTSPLGRDLIGGWRAAGLCEIGAQLHAWVNPPHVEEVSVANSFAGNLPPGLERQKLEVLTDGIAEAFGEAPRIYKAGRYGLGPSTATTLERLGYAVDTSVLPHTDLRFKLGPDLRCFGPQPFLFGEARQLLQLPVTRGFIGHAPALGAAI
jgi:hypothetical protein